MAYLLDMSLLSVSENRLNSKPCISLSRFFLYPHSGEGGQESTVRIRVAVFTPDESVALAHADTEVRHAVVFRMIQ